jgi:DNA polymerase I
VSGSFTNITVCDFEYEVADGDLPNVLCMVTHVLDGNFRHVRTIRMWRDEFGSTPPFDVGPDSLFVAYSAWAEMTCFMTLGWKFPAHIFDQHTAYLAASNVLLPYNPDEVRKRQRKRLSDACRSYLVPGWERIDKETIAKDIGEGRWRDHGKEVVLAYCEEDVRASTALLLKQLQGFSQFDPADVERVLFWSEYSSKAVAQIQAQGMPIDMVLWNLVQDNKDAVIRHLLQTFDPSHSTDNPIHTPDGHWSDARFEQWLISVGITVWPRLDSGKIQTDGDAFKLMYHVPGIEGLHALKDSLGVVVRAKLPIGADGRNRPSLFPFCTTTSRNAHARSLFNAHAGMRGFMLFPPDKIAAYLDFRTQEIVIAATQSGDRQLIRDVAGDVYHALALMCGLTTDPDPVHWKSQDANKSIRQRMKSLQLGINYGMGVPSLAKGLDRHPVVASTIIEMHKRRYPRYWEWKEERANAAMQDRVMESVFGWPMYLSNSPNRRTLYNFPMQSGGAEMLRLAATRLCEAGIVPSMLVHDAVLLELDNEEQVAHAVEIMKSAGRDVCNGFDIGVDVERMKDGRFRDKRLVAKKMWATVMQALQAVGALPEGTIP